MSAGYKNHEKRKDTDVSRILPFFMVFPLLMNCVENKVDMVFIIKLRVYNSCYSLFASERMSTIISRNSFCNYFYFALNKME
jgi:hypothetical protein